MHPSTAWCLALIGITALWGWSFVAIHDALSTLTASSLNALRFLSGTIVMVIFIPRLKALSLKEVGNGVLAGSVLFLAFTFQTSGLTYTSASNASFITGLAILFTPLFALLFLKLRPSKQQLLGGLTATAGLALLTLKGLSIHLGDLLVLICAAFTALHIVTLYVISKRTDTAALAFLQISTVAILSLIWSVSAGEFKLPKSMSVTYPILIIGIVGTALAFFIQTKAQTTASPSTIALILVLEPVFGGIFGYFLGGDRLSTINMAGALLIIIGMIISETGLKITTIGKIHDPQSKRPQQ
ncbi:DMT family transporter [Pseudomonas kairouanensis]|uniref:DMT family transporter n=1 Tax=Pseudomonas kairouanensis TaxID=2293832 RepID=A0A4Z0B1K6_9PSED|nr:DMT family transporter [Pseudomonas kairouanensis]TFY92108.1 DMT family transporter [Pseudomonas kairouanensis]